jgi:hypothetical protein
MITANVMAMPMATMTSPTTETDVGTCDHPKRWATALITIAAGNDSNVSELAIFCALRVSAVGPPRMRR